MPAVLTGSFPVAVGPGLSTPLLPTWSQGRPWPAQRARQPPWAGGPGPGWALSSMSKPAGGLGAGWGATRTTLSFFLPTLNKEGVPVQLNTCSNSSQHRGDPEGSHTQHPKS